MEPLSQRQIQTIASIQKAKLDIHCGPYGCGKSYAVDIGLGLACKNSKPPTDGSVITLVGKTSQSVKTNIGNSLAAKFGSNFRYDSGKKDGFAKDAVLFGHLIRIVGLNDSNAEERIRGLNTYKIYGDEISTWSEENFNKIFGRLRGAKPEGWEFGLVGTTNPDSPKHWLWKKILQERKDENMPLDKRINYIQWTEHDNITSMAKQYYEDLKARYKNSPAYYTRYVKGGWAAAEGLVYTEYNEKMHILDFSTVAQLMPDFVSFIIAVDFGTTNPTAILVIGVTEIKEYVVVRETYMLNATLSKAIRAIRSYVVEFNTRLKRIVVDPAAKVLIEGLKEEGFNSVVGGNNSVMNGINYVKDLFTGNKLFISEVCTNLQEELLTYAYSDKDGVNVVKTNDHACDALRYGLYD